MRFNCQKRKKIEKKENRRKGLKITSKQIGRGTNCSSSSLFSLEFFIANNYSAKWSYQVSNHEIVILMVICQRKQNQAFGERFSP